MRKSLFSIAAFSIFFVGASLGFAQTTSTTCLQLTNNLYLGLTDAQTNGEVTRLQQFLAQYPQYYPQGLVTGYFGPLTEQAVQAYQAANNIVSSGTSETTGYGVVGAQTRQALAASCPADAISTNTSASATTPAASTVGSQSANSAVGKVTNGMVRFVVNKSCDSGNTTVAFTWKSPTTDAQGGTCVPNSSAIQGSDSAADQFSYNSLPCSGSYTATVVPGNDYTYQVLSLYSDPAGNTYNIVRSGKFVTPSVSASCTQAYGGTPEGASGMETSVEVNTGDGSSGPVDTGHGDLSQDQQDAINAEANQNGREIHEEGVGTEADTPDPSVEANPDPSTNGDSGIGGPSMSGSAALLGAQAIFNETMHALGNFFDSLGL